MSSAPGTNITLLNTTFTHNVAASLPSASSAPPPSSPSTAMPPSSPADVGGSAPAPLSPPLLSALDSSTSPTQATSTGADGGAVYMEEAYQIVFFKVSHDCLVRMSS